MALHPTLDELEQAILSYTSASLKGGLKEWQAMKWLWDQLSWSARLVTHFGASGSTWWKERYVFPVLCQESRVYLQQFLRGDWTRAQEESLRYCFHFFAPYATKNPQLFPPEIFQFLSGHCPSFNTEREFFQSRQEGRSGTKDCSWLRDETFARYRSRMQSLLRRAPSQRIVDKEEPASVLAPAQVDTIKNETREKSKKRIEEITTLRDEIADLSSQVEQEYATAFPIRQEAEQTVFTLKSVKEAMLTLLLEVDEVLLGFSEYIAGASSDTEARRVIKDVEAALKEFRQRSSKLKTEADQISAMIEEKRQAIIKSLHNLTRVLDHVPMLASAHPFRVHQTRVVRIGREKLKRFRGALTRGPGPEMLLCHLEREIAGAAELAISFYDEGSDISSMKEKLSHIELCIQDRLAKGVPSSPTAPLRTLLSQVLELKKTLEVAADRRARFEQIGQAMREFELYKT